MLARNDRVKLTEKFALTLNRGIMKVCRIDWRLRRGVVINVNPRDALVRWDGNSSPERIPLKGLEKA